MKTQTGILIAIFSLLQAAPKIAVLSDSPIELKFRVTNEAQSPDDLKPFTILIGFPSPDYPEINVRKEQVRSVPENVEFPETGIRWIHSQTLRGLITGSLEISCLKNESEYFESLLITLTFAHRKENHVSASLTQERFLKSRVLNWKSSKNWFQPKEFPTRLRLIDYPAGTWYTFTVSEDGVHAITGSTLLEQRGLDSGTDPQSIMLFTGTQGGRDRTFDLTQGTQSTRTIPENLQEISVLFLGEENNQLDASDSLIFYGRGSSGFNTEDGDVIYHQNLYFTENTYWLLIPDDGNERGARMTVQSSQPSPLVSLDYGISYFHSEFDLINPFESGMAWVGSSIAHNTSFSILVDLGSVETTVPAVAKLSLYGGESVSTNLNNTTHMIKLYHQNTAGSALTSLSWSNLGSKSITDSLAGLSNGVNSFFIKNESSSSNSKPYMDSFTLSYGKTLTADDSYEFFSPITGNDITFSFSGIPDNVWNITEIEKPVPLIIDKSDDNGSVSVSQPADTAGRYIVFNATGISGITDLRERDENPFGTLRQQLAGVEHLIIGPESFRSAADPLVSHRGNSKYIALEDIYNEFSGGNADPVAIRFFLQWTQEQWSGTVPLYVLFLGDADYDYRNISGNSKNRVPTIEVGTTSSRATDDRLATMYGRIPELATGRFPAASESEVSDFVDKLIEFETSPIFGLWRQRVTLVADDAARPENEMNEITTGKSHTNNSEDLSQIVPPSVEVQKLYMLEYPEVSDASTYGVSKPDATRALLDALKKGTSIINYIGHGSSSQWAQENLLGQSRDAQSIDTGMKLPIWIAGTCSWGFFDQVDAESFAEEIIRQEENGAAAIISTSRAISVYSNQVYLEALFNALFPDGKVTHESIGSVLQSVKTGAQAGELFHLFGDPAMNVTIPSDSASVTSVSPDTLKTLSTASFSGQWTEAEGKTGNGYITLLDADRSVTRQYNFLSTVQSLTYSLPGATLFRGQFSISGLGFSGQLRIPKDISYSNDPGQLRVYVTLDENSTEALGSKTGIILSGGKPVQDYNGPLITFETKDGRTLRSGDHINRDEGLAARLSDPLGINLTGEIGHEIILTNIQSDEEKDLTSGFVYDLDKITTGIVEISLEDQSDNIAIVLKAWDNANNPSEAEIYLSISETQQLNLFRVLNFPNPFRTETQFTFEISSPATVSIDIYTLGGRRIKSFGDQYLTTGVHFIDWDGRDEYGHRLANGSYLYKILAVNGDQQVSQIKTVVKLQ